MQVQLLTKKDPIHVLLILIVVFLTLGSGIIWLGERLDIRFLFSAGHTIIITGGLWLICRTYVKFLWRKYPWESYPQIHIILEVTGIGVLTTIYGSLLYLVEIRIGVFDPVEGIWIQAMITLLITYLITGIHEMVFFYNQWIYHFSKSVRLEKDSIEAKYETLKTQVNPHFLFNTLNSLTHMVDDHPGAVEYIRNLSEFLRYMLSSRNKDLVYLKDELKVLRHYLELQQSRFLDNLRVDWMVPDKYHLYTLPPLALQMLVENCIKHNVISSEKPLTITIDATDEQLMVKNNLQRKTRVDSTGQGLRNLVERYRYFTSKEVHIHETDREYTVSIPLLIMEL